VKEGCQQPLLNTGSARPRLQRVLVELWQNMILKSQPTLKNLVEQHVKIYQPFEAEASLNDI
jgi:hypothetical protein